jgi:hypothetical protein
MHGLRLFAGGIFLALLIAPIGSAQTQIIHPDLREHMDAAAPGERIASYVVMSDQLSLRWFEQQTGGMSPKECRSFVAAQLKSHAQATQVGVREFLAGQAAAGRAEITELLWMGNAIYFDAEPSVIEGLSVLPGIHRIRRIVDDGLAMYEDASPVTAAPLGGGGPTEQNIIQLQAPQLWDIGYDGEDVLIANIDSGVTWTHPDLIQHIWRNPNEIPNNGVDDDLNGKIDDIVGWDFANNGNDPKSSSTHGTQTCGLMVGDGTNGSTTGMAIGGDFVPMEISGEANYWSAQQYALDIGVDVVCSSHSFKWPFSPKPDYHMHRQLCDMELAAAIIHANSIGNQGNSTGSGYPIPWNVSAPGNCPQPWGNPEAAVGGRSSVMGCAGIHVADDSLYTSSGQGHSAWEDISGYDPAYPHTQLFAYWDYPWAGTTSPMDGLLKPDVCTYTDSVLSTTNSGGYSGFGGTSAATPQLGGGMMLLRDVQPEALPRHIAAAIELTAFDLGPPGKDTRYGAGKLQVFDAGRRLVVLGRAFNQTPALGDQLAFDIFGQPNTTVYVFYANAIVNSTSALNLVLPFFSLGTASIDASGKGALALTIPVVPALVGTYHFQFGAQNQDPSWGPGVLLSVPEQVNVTN